MVRIAQIAHSLTNILLSPRRLRALSEPQAVFVYWQTYLDEQLACIRSIMSGFNDLDGEAMAKWNKSVQREDAEYDGRPVVMLKGFGDGNRGELVAMSNTMADWLKQCGYVREATEEDFDKRRRKRRRPIKRVRQLHRARLIHGGV